MKRNMFIRKDGERVSQAIATIWLMAVIVIAGTAVYLTPRVGCGCARPQKPPTGTWGNQTIVSPTEIVVEFGEMSRKVAPYNLELILTEDGTSEARCTFLRNEDWRLYNRDETSNVTLSYEDLEDNLQVDAGDRIRLKNLDPSSEYVLTMIWLPTGDEIASTELYLYAE